MESVTYDPLIIKMNHSMIIVKSELFILCIFLHMACYDLSENNVIVLYCIKHSLCNFFLTLLILGNFFFAV